MHVDANGPGSIESTTDYKTIQQALDHAPEAPHGRIFIHIAPGTYHERINVTQNRPRLTLLGEGKTPADVVIDAAQNAKMAGGTFFTETAEIDGDNFEADNVTFANTAGNTGQAVAAAVRSDRAVFKHCRFLGHQDTLFADWGRQYYLDSYIEGGVDFIFGNATAVFDRSEVHALSPGYLTAQSRTAPTQTTGYVFTRSRVTTAALEESTLPPAGAPGAASTASATRNGRPFTFLGRPWRPYSRVVFMHTELPAALSPAGWSRWKSTDTGEPLAYYAEFDNSGPGARPADRIPWSHQLSAAEASAFEPGSFLRHGSAPGQPDWDPEAEAARLP